MSNAIFGIHMEPTVIHRIQSKRRPSLPEGFQAVGASALSPPASPANSNTAPQKRDTSNSSPSKAAESSTDKTSLDSAVRDADLDMCSSESGHHLRGGQQHVRAGCRRGPKLGADNITRSAKCRKLATIRETPPHWTVPSIVTVELVAAAKIYLETHFEQLLTAGPSPREIRLQLLEIDLFHRSRIIGMPLDPAEIQVEYSKLYRRESEYLREVRTMKTRSLRALRMPHVGRQVDLIDEYKTLKVLGKGSYGVVKLVRDRAKGQVYAMKVIKKSNTLRTSQECHLRAERDFLVASEGSRWYGTQRLCFL